MLTLDSSDAVIIAAAQAYRDRTGRAERYVYVVLHDPRRPSYTPGPISDEVALHRAEVDFRGPVPVVTRPR